MLWRSNHILEASISLFVTSKTEERKVNFIIKTKAFVSMYDTMWNI